MEKGKPLLEYFDYSFQELYSLEEMLEAFGQQQVADVLRSVVEMAYGKLAALDALLEQQIGRIEVQLDESGQPQQTRLTAKPSGESVQ